MHLLTRLSFLAALVAFGSANVLKAEAQYNLADTISLEADQPNSFRNFAPELPQMRARAAQINTDFGLHVSEIEPGLFFVTDLIYQSAFLVTDDGVVALDAPPSFGKNLRKAIEIAAPDKPITHLIMSHGHRDHNGGGFAFADIPELQVVAAVEVAETLQKFPLDGILTPTLTFKEALDLTIGGVDIELRTTRFHSDDKDVMIYLPAEKFLMAIDTITPGEAPFMNFGATSDVRAYLQSFDTLLAYDFEHFLSGHVSVLGNRQDVVSARDYAFDVRDTVFGLMPTMHDTFMEGMNAVEFQHGNLAYRYAIESIRDECANQVINRWNDKLSIVDLWADSHCETIVLHSIMH